MKTLLLMIHFSALGFYANLVGAQSTMMHPAICEAINPGQSLEMEWREWVLVNRGTRNLWVMCPIVVEHLSDYQSTTIQIEVWNGNPGVAQIDCYLRYYSPTDLTNGFMARKSQSESLALTSEEARFGLFEVSGATKMPSVACRLPPDTAISQLQSWTF